METEEVSKIDSISSELKSSELKSLELCLEMEEEKERLLLISSGDEEPQNNLRITDSLTSADLLKINSIKLAKNKRNRERARKRKSTSKTHLVLGNVRAGTSGLATKPTRRTTPK